jgi:hypothetical protein
MPYNLYNMKMKQAGASIHHVPRSLYNNNVRTSGSGQPFNEQLVPLPIYFPGLATDYGWHDKQTTPSSYENFTNNAGTNRLIGSSGSGTDRRSQGVVRFDNLPLSGGVTIQSASLHLYFNGGVGAPLFRIYALDEDDGNCPANLSEWQTDVASNLTSANVAYLPTIFETAGYVASADIKTVVQEVVDRPGWSSLNALVLFVLDESPTQFQYRTVYMHHTDQNKVPYILIYT